MATPRLAGHVTPLLGVLVEPMEIGAHAIQFKAGAVHAPGRQGIGAAAPAPQEGQEQLTLAAGTKHLWLHHVGATIYAALPICSDFSV